ncbi:MAG: hypothetical protein Pg6C_14530 [Treponemataceae bacterium]|nr:MAG: hypothetical protein Pg6C_14530 [Treponemataceae bacterium]
MKVILNQDVKYLGEEGDAKTVANGYARNYLFPRKLAMPYNPYSVKLFEGKKAEIEKRKLLKRTDAQSLKEKLEALALEITMSSGPTGKLYGAVTNQTIADELAKNGFDIERKRIEIPGLTIKHTGKYTVSVHLYELSSADVRIVVTSQEEIETKRRAAAAEAAKQAKAAKKAASQTENAPAEPQEPVSSDS